MKILITANASWNIAHFRKPVVEALVRDGHEVVVLAPEDDAVARLKAMGVRHVVLHMDNKGLNPVRDLKLLLQLRREMRAQAPDIVLSYTIKPNIYGALAAKSLGLPFVPNVSGLGTVFLNAGWLERIATTLYRGAFRNLGYVIFQNADDRDLFIERGIITSKQARIVPGSGIDLDHFKPAQKSPDEVTVFLLIARMLRDKGVKEYVEAARIIKGSFPEARFQLLGACGVENRTAFGAETINGWVEEGLVEYLGELPDVREAILKSDCVVLPSYREGLPRALLEGSAMGKPLIATDVAGCRDVVEDRVTGLLCDAKSVNSLKESLETFLGMSPSARLAMGNAGRKKVEKEFGQEIVVKIYKDTIEVLVKKNV